MKIFFKVSALVLACVGSMPVFASPAEQSDLTITEQTFDCIREMTPVRGFYVDNLMGDLEGTLAVANSPTGGVYPAGSVVQLVPGEVMVKHPAGYSPATKDWEFNHDLSRSENDLITFCKPHSYEAARPTMSRIDAGSLASATNSDVSAGAPTSSRTASSLSALRPAIAQRSP